MSALPPAADDPAMASTALPRPADLVAAALTPGCCPHSRQRDLVRASLIVRG
jgi:hypothetical protein